MGFDLQGHRGARGLAPENTLAGFTVALAIGVTTLEGDLAVTRDDVVVLSHDPILNPDITRGPDGRWLHRAGPPIRSLSLNELQRFDVGRIAPGSGYARQFPVQVPVDGARIPALGEVFSLAEASGKAPRYNLEIKISPLRPDETADPATFARLAIAAVRRAGVLDRTMIQSFDMRALLETRRQAPEIATSCLTMDTEEWSNLRDRDGRPSPWLAGIGASRPMAAAPELARAVGCSTWSPYWRNLDGAAVALAHDLGLKVLPWTLNMPADMAAAIDMGVDGLITDYPDLARELIASKGLPLL